VRQGEALAKWTRRMLGDQADASRRPRLQLPDGRRTLSLTIFSPRPSQESEAALREAESMFRLTIWAVFHEPRL
jgi:hypothetical protein